MVGRGPAQQATLQVTLLAMFLPTTLDNQRRRRAARDAQRMQVLHFFHAAGGLPRGLARRRRVERPVLGALWSTSTMTASGCDSPLRAS